MERILSGKQMKSCDQNTICQIGIPSLVLMERAALTVVEEMYRANFDLTSVLVLCGSGNNGGDGFAIARILDERGVPVTVAFVGKDSSMSGETGIQRKICETCKIKIVSNSMEGEYTTIVDAIFGIGLSRPVAGNYAEVIEWINHQQAKVVAADIPSGICADTGKVMGTAVKADLTVTFAYRKPGQILYPGTQYCGTVICRGIGILQERLEDEVPELFSYSKEDLEKIPCRNPYSNKGTFGKVLLIAGSEGMSGAACLAALAAYRSGCGLVRVFTPECNRAVIQTYLPEAIVTAYDSEGFPLKKLEEVLSWADVTGIGPGLGTQECSAQILEYVLKNFKKPLVIDADGLNMLAHNKAPLRDRNGPVILTPHIGEMMRLLDVSKEAVLENIMETAKQFAKKYGVICALKDARTIVSDGEKTYINESGNSGMATGGSGDVLTGVICGLLAQGMQPFEGAAVGVYLHGLAGDAARVKKGAYAVLASDIADGVGAVLREFDCRQEKGE